MNATDSVLPCLWFDGAAEAPVAMYCATLPDPRIGHVLRQDAQGASRDGEAFIIEFTLGRTAFLSMNGGPGMAFAGATSMVARCDTQQERDRIWDALVECGRVQRCGWLINRFGASWRIAPRMMPQPMRGRVGGAHTDGEARHRRLARRVKPASERFQP